MQGKRIVLSTFGSFGDIHPYVAIALELKARGHQPVIATSEIYREKMETVGLEFFPVRPDMPSIDQPDEVAKVVGEVMDPKRGPEAVVRKYNWASEEKYLFGVYQKVCAIPHQS